MDRTFNPNELRQEFPSLARTQDGRPVVYFDGPGGTQVPQRVIDAINRHYLEINTHTGGAFSPSQRLDMMIAEARAICADFFNAPSSGESASDEIAFSLNMTTHTYNISRSIGKTLRPGDELIVTVLDHESNASPWVALEEHGVKVHCVDINPEDCTLDMADFESKLSEHTKVVAVGSASNAVGTINDVRTIAQMAHSVGAIVYIDATHYAPHVPIDVQYLDADFLACSAYKFFGPHGVGVLYGKKDIMESLPAYKVRPSVYQKFESGTQNFEGLSGLIAAIEYLAELGKKSGAPYLDRFPDLTGRRLDLKAAMSAIREYEMGLFARLMDGIRQIPGLKIWGISDPANFDRRTPTLAFTLSGFSPHQVAEYLGKRGIFVWDGDFYAQALIERLGLFETGGVVRVGLTHYNTADEVDRFLSATGALTSRKSK
jgi:cysteine desulfurase family protein (TIGR01976 family)